MTPGSQGECDTEAPVMTNVLNSDITGHPTPTFFSVKIVNTV